jgi:hypothetical protein
MGAGIALFEAKHGHAQLLRDINGRPVIRTAVAEEYDDQRRVSFDEGLQPIRPGIGRAAEVHGALAVGKQPVSAVEIDLQRIIAPGAESPGQGVEERADRPLQEENDGLRNGRVTRGRSGVIDRPEVHVIAQVYKIAAAVRDSSELSHSEFLEQQ